MPVRERIQIVPGLGEMVRARLRARGMTQLALAAKVGVSRPTLQRVLERDEITRAVARKIASILGDEVLRAVVFADASSTQAPGALSGAPASSATAASTPPTGEHPATFAVRTGRDSVAGLTAFGLVLEAVREDEQMSQEELAKAAGISVTSYRRIIRGDAHMSVGARERLAERLDLSADDLERAVAIAWTDATQFVSGRVLRAWRLATGYSLTDVGDYLGMSSIWVAMFEAGHEDVVHAVEEFSRLYGTTGDVFYRAVMLQMPEAARGERPVPVHRVLTFERAIAEGRRAQERREEHRDADPHDPNRGIRMERLRRSAGWSKRDVEERTGVSADRVFAMEEGGARPTLRELERLATLYRTTPWELYYGDPWTRAWAFPAADWSRATIVATGMPPRVLAYLYRVLAAFAERGVHEDELHSVKRSLTAPDYYYGAEIVTEDAERALLLLALLHEQALELWTSITAPAWLDPDATRRETRASETGEVPHPVFADVMSEDEWAVVERVRTTIEAAFFERRRAALDALPSLVPNAGNGLPLPPYMSYAEERLDEFLETAAALRERGDHKQPLDRQATPKTRGPAASPTAADASGQGGTSRSNRARKSTRKRRD